MSSSANEVNMRLSREYLLDLINKRCTFEEWQTKSMPLYHPDFTQHFISGESFDLTSTFEQIKGFYGENLHQLYY